MATAPDTMTVKVKVEADPVDVHRVRIVGGPEGYKCRVWLDGEQVYPTAVTVAAAVDGLVVVALSFIADVVVDIEAVAI